MKKVRRYIIPTLVLILFIAIMTSGGFLKRSFSNIDDVNGSIEVLKKDVINENWKQAEIDFKKLKVAWRKVEKRVQFSVERDEMNMIDTNIARIGGALSVRDKSSSVIELSEITNHWNELEK